MLGHYVIIGVKCDFQAVMQDLLRLEPAKGATFSIDKQTTLVRLRKRTAPVYH